MKRTNKLLNWILPLISIACIFLLWGVSALAINNEFMLPSVSLTFSALIDLLKSGEFYISFLMTLVRSLISFICSFTLAFLLALLNRRFSIARSLFAPIISIIRALPTIAVVLLLLFWTNSFVAPIIVTFLVVFPTTYTNVCNALDVVDKRQIEMCKVFNVSRKDILFKVEIPQIMPSMYSTIGSGLSLNIKLMVAAEVLSATANSLGYMLNTAKIYFETATMLAIVVFAVAVGLIIDLVFNLLSKRAGKWR